MSCKILFTKLHVCCFKYYISYIQIDRWNRVMVMHIVIILIRIIIISICICTFFYRNGMTSCFNGTPKTLVIWKLFGFPANAYGCRTSCCTTSSKFRFMCAFNKCTKTKYKYSCHRRKPLCLYCFSCIFSSFLYIIFFCNLTCIWIFSVFCFFFYLCMWIFAHFSVLFLLLIINFFILSSFVRLWFSVCVHYLLACLTIY